MRRRSDRSGTHSRSKPVTTSGSRMPRMDAGVVRRDPVGGARRVQVRRPRDGGRVPCSRRGRRHRQRPAQDQSALPRALLRRVRARCRRQQHRGGLPEAPVIQAVAGATLGANFPDEGTASVTATPSAAAPWRRCLGAGVCDQPGERVADRHGRSGRARRTSRRGRACPRESCCIVVCQSRPNTSLPTPARKAAATTWAATAGSRGRRAVRAGAGSRTSRPAACAAARRPTRPPTSRLMACSVRIAPRLRTARREAASRRRARRRRGTCGRRSRSPSRGRRRRRGSRPLPHRRSAPR